MPRFFGKIGYGVSTLIRPGVYEDSITEKEYYGNIQQNQRYLSSGDSTLGTMTFQTTISVVADAYALENWTAIKYIKWAGSDWSITSVKVDRPRLTLMLGGVYNGPTASTTP